MSLAGAMRDSGEYERRDGGDGSREALSAGGYQHTRRETTPPAA